MRILPLLFLFLQSAPSHSQLVGNDYNYKVHQSGQYRIIYSEEYQQMIKDLSLQNQWLLRLYNQEFDWTFDEDAVLVLASSQNQIPNGFATQYPRLMTYFFNGGPKFIDEFGIVSWVDVLLLHETVHLYQLNTRAGYSSLLKSVFGNALPNIAIPFTYTITPHFFTPTFMIEGNATFNEGRFGNGGRLYSGFYRALFIQLVKHDKVTPNRIMNDRIDWPFGTEKYIVGGYFNSHLAEEFSPQLVNKFFRAHTHREFFPFNLDGTFLGLFGKGYDQIFSDLNSKYSKIADNQKESQGQLLQWSYDHSAFTKQNGEIAFMVNSYEGLPKLCRLPYGRTELQCDKVRLPFGRVFRHQGEWVSSAYSKVHPTEARASLFRQGFRPIKEFNDRLVYQLDDTRAAYADTRNSFGKTRVYLNDEFFDEMQSSPHMDAEGNLYYFKQKGNYRQLYRNQKVILQVDGFYGRVVDLDDQGRIYFTGATEGGSSLFRWDGKDLLRVLSSDLVIDAKLTGARTALVAEVTSENIQYRIVNLKSHRSQPVLYKYTYDSDELARAYFDSTQTKSPTTSKTGLAYSPLRNLELNGIDPSFGYSNVDGPLWLLNFRWSDPLQRYLMSFLVGDSGWNSYVGLAQLTSQMNRWQWSVQASFDQDPVVETFGPNIEDQRVLGRISDTEFTGTLTYPFFSTPLWKSRGQISYNYESVSADEEVSSFANNEYVNSVTASYDVAYSYQNLLDHEPNRLAALDLKYRHEGEGSGWDKGTPVYIGKASIQKDIGRQTFFSATYTAALADGERDTLRLKKSQTISQDPTELTQYSTRYFSDGFYELRKVNAELKQSVLFGLYHKWIPVGLRRLAPFAGYSEFYGSEVRDRGASTLFHEIYYGIELELLLLHKFPARVSVFSAESSLDPENNLHVMFTL